MLAWKTLAKQQHSIKHKCEWNEKFYISGNWFWVWWTQSKQILIKSHRQQDTGCNKQKKNTTTSSNIGFLCGIDVFLHRCNSLGYSMAATQSPIKKTERKKRDYSQNIYSLVFDRFFKNLVLVWHDALEQRVPTYILFVISHGSRLFSVGIQNRINMYPKKGKQTIKRIYRHN